MNYRLILASLLVGALLGACKKEEPTKPTPGQQEQKKEEQPQSEKKDSDSTPEPEVKPEAPAQGLLNGILYYFSGDYDFDAYTTKGERRYPVFNLIKPSGELEKNLFKTVTDEDFGFKIEVKRQGDKICVLSRELTPTPRGGSATENTQYKFHTFNVATGALENSITLKAYKEEGTRPFYQPVQKSYAVVGENLYLYYSCHLSKINVKTGEVLKADIPEFHYSRRPALRNNPRISEMYTYGDKIIIIPDNGLALYTLNTQTDAVVKSEIGSTIYATYQISDDLLLIKVNSDLVFKLYSLKENNIIGGAFKLDGNGTFSQSAFYNKTTKKLYYSLQSSSSVPEVRVADLSSAIDATAQVNITGKIFHRFTLEESSYSLAGSYRLAYHPTQNKLYIAYLSNVAKPRLAIFDLTTAPDENATPTSDEAIEGMHAISGIFFNAR